MDEDESKRMETPIKSQDLVPLPAHTASHIIKPVLEFKTDSYLVASLVRACLWVGFNEFAVHQGKDGLTFLPLSQKGLRALIAFPYSNAKRNK